MWEDLSFEEYVMGEEKFNEKGAGFSKITIKKNNEKIKHENVFSIESKEVAFKLNTNRDYHAYEGFQKYFSIKSEVFRKR